MTLPLSEVRTTSAKPFLKWAGGKAQLIDQISNYLPAELRTGLIQKYAEPFVGGGALFFHIARTYEVEEFLIADVNEELILAYRTVKKDVQGLIDALNEMQKKYHRHSCG